MKALGYAFCALAVIVLVLALVDSAMGEVAGQIWFYMDIIICAALIVCMAVGFRDYMQSDRSKGIAWSLLLSVFAFFTFTETFIHHELGLTLPPLIWLWIDGIVIVALLHAGSRMIASGQESA